MVTVLVVAAVLLTVAVLVVGLFIVGAKRDKALAPDTGPLAVPTAPAPGADGRWCTEFMEFVPDQLDDQPRRELLVAEPGVAAWGDPAMILRCGLADPAELRCDATLTQVLGKDGGPVEWLETRAGSSVTYLAVDRPVRIAITLSASTTLTPVQELSEIIEQALPAQKVCDRGKLVPADNS